MPYLAQAFIRFAITLRFFNGSSFYYVNDRRIHDHNVTDARVSATGQLELKIDDQWQAFRATRRRIIGANLSFHVNRTRFTPIKSPNVEIVAESLALGDVFIWQRDCCMQVGQSSTRHMLAIVHSHSEQRLQLLVSTSDGVLEYPFESCEYVSLMATFNDFSDQLYGHNFIATVVLYDQGKGVLPGIDFDPEVVTNFNIDNRRLFNLQLERAGEVVNCYIQPNHETVVFEDGAHVALADFIQ